MQSSVNLIMNKHSTQVIHQTKANVTFDDITFFDLWASEVDSKTAQLSASLWIDSEEKTWCCQNT